MQVSAFIPLILCFLLILPTVIRADPPRPPLGKKWVLNEQFSDEFNGTQLDKTKWYDYHPTWAGREPGIFLPSQVTVKDGLMRIQGKKLPQKKVITSADIVTQEGTDRTYTIAGGAVISKTEEAYFGYYEARFKAAKTTMSTTFWLATRNWDFPGPKPCNDRYGLELDIQESIGREGNFDGKIFAKGMHSNGHFWYADCDGKMQDLRSKQVVFQNDSFASARFNTYGGWWHDESSASFYLNNGDPKFMTFYSEVKDNPFDQPMGVNLVSETYPFPWIELPNDKELADPSKNVAYYDWVRAYKLVDAIDNVNTQIDTQSSAPIFDEIISIHSNSVSLQNDSSLQFLIEYKTNQRRIIEFIVYDQAGKTIGQYSSIVNAGFAFVPVEVDLIDSHSIHSKLSITARLKVNTAKTVSDSIYQKTVNLPQLKTLETHQQQIGSLPKITLKDNDTLLIADAQRLASYSLMSTDHTEVKSSITYTNEIDFSGLNSGSYLLKIDGVWFAKVTKL
jgi:hypothetical protein